MAEFDTSSATPVDDNEFDPFSATEEVKRDPRRAAVVRQALDSKPDDWAESVLLAKRTGIPAEVVERNLPDVKKKVTVQDIEEMLNGAPESLQAHAANVGFAKLAVDDLQTLVEITGKQMPALSKGYTFAQASKAQRRARDNAFNYSLSSAATDERYLTSDGQEFEKDDNLELNWRIGLNTLRSTYHGLKAAAFADLPNDLGAQAGLAEQLEAIRKVQGENAALQGLTRESTQRFFASANDQMSTMEQLSELGSALAEDPVGIGADLFLQSGPASLATLAAAALARFGGGSLPTIGTAGGSASAVIETGNRYTANLQKGMPHEEAWNEAVVSGAIVGAFDAVSIASAGAVVGNMVQAGVAKRVGQVAKEVGAQAVLGAGGEALAGLAVGEFASPADMAAEALGEVFGAGFEGVVASPRGAVRAILSGAAKGDQRITDANADLERAQSLANLFNTAAQSLTRTRDADSFAQLVQNAADENGAPSHIYVNGQVLAQTLEQAGIDPAGIPSVAAGLQEAIAMNKDVAIPIGEATAVFSGTGVEEALLQQVKFEAEGLTVAEAKQVFEQQADILREEAQGAIAQQADVDAWNQSSQTVYENIFGQLGQANRFTADVNQAYAGLVRDFYTATAGRMSMTPEELYQEFPLSIQAESPITRAMLSQQDAAKPNVSFEVAPDPNDVALAERWRGLTPEARLRISTQVAEQVVPGVLQTLNTSGSIEAQVGGYLGETNPSLALRVDDPALAVEVAKALGVVLSQDSMVVVSATPVPGTEPTGAVTVTLPEGADFAYIDALYQKLWELEANGDKLVGGHSTANGQMLILNFSDLPIEQFAQLIDQHLGGALEVNIDDVYTAFPENGKDYDYGSDRQEGATPAGGASAEGRSLGDIRREASQRIQAAIGAAEGGGVLEQRATAAQARVSWEDNFRQWAGTDIVLEPREINDTNFSAPGPYVLRAYHGTTNTFDEFDASIKGNLEGQFGAVNYFTSSQHDASANYAGEGPDLTSRIENLRERLEQEYADAVEEGHDADSLASDINQRYQIDLQPLDIPRVDNDMDGEIDPIELAAVVANRVLHGGDEIVMEVFIKTERPFVVGDVNSPWLDFFDEEALEAEAIERVADNNGVTPEDVRADRDSYEDTIQDARYEIMEEQDNPVVEAVQQVANKYDFDPSDLLASIYEMQGDGSVRHNQLEEFMRQNESLVYAEHPNDGALVQSHMIGEIIQALGFDSIILKNADVRFKGMDMERGTAHIHIFDANNTNIKSVDNSGTFDPNDANIYLQGADDRAPLGTFDPQNLVLALRNGANLSTFLHETGHFFLEVQAALAARPDAPAEIKKDMQAILDWFGVPDLATWRAMDLEAQRPYHEQFARGFEAYTFEGNSPSLDIEKVFQRFATWMRQVYRTLQTFLVQHNVVLNNEIRAVFDRMLASETQILMAQQTRSFRPLFESAEQAGMSPEDWADYQAINADATDDAVSRLERRSLRDMRWLSNARDRILKALQKEAAALRKSVNQEVAKEVANEPVYQALNFLKRGEMSTPDGEEIKVAEGFKLAKEALIEMYPPGELGGPDLSGLKGLTGTEGLHPDMVAPMFGFSSGDHLVRAILDAQPMADVVDAMTDQRMLERHGDLTNPDVMQRAADEAIHNEARTRFVATELTALNKALGDPRSLVKAAKQVAGEVVARRKVRDLRPNEFISAEVRAGKAAEAALKKGDINAAAQAKRDQLLNNAATRAAMDAIGEVEKALRYFEKFDSDTVRQRIDPDYVDQIEALLDRFDLRKGQTLTAIDRRKTLADWVESVVEAVGIEPDIDPQLINEANRKHYKDMTIEELRGLVDAIRQIDHIGRLKSKLLTAKDKREFGERVELAVTSIEQNANRTVKDRIERSGLLDRIKDGAGEYFAMHRKLASLIREMDGGKDIGVMWELFVRPMNERGDMEAAARAKASSALNELFKPLFEAGQLTKKTFIPAIGDSLTKEARLLVALNWGNEANRQRVMDGDNWSLQQVDAVLASLTAQDWQFVQNVWDYIDSYWPEIAAKERRVTGIEPDKVAPAPVQTRFGQLRGGYFPIMYDPNRSSKAEAHSDAEVAKQMMQGSYTRASTRRGHTKERVDQVIGRPVRKDFGVISQHLNQVIHDLSWHEWLIDASRLLRSSRMDAAIREAYGPALLRMMKNTVRDIAAGEVAAQNVFERSIGHLRTGATVAGLGWNLFTSLLQPLGLTQSMVRIGPKWVGKGVAQLLSDPTKINAKLEWIRSKSTFMRERGRTMQREINEVLNKVDNKLSAVESSFFWASQAAQTMADAPTWLGQYEKAMAIDGMDEATAIAAADQAVLDAQGGGQVKDLAGIQRGGPMMKLWTNFYSYFNVTYNLAAERTRLTNFKSPAEVGALAVDYLLLMVVPSVLSTLLRAALKGGGDDDDDLTDKIIQDQMSYLFGLVVGLREIGGVFGQFGYGGPAGLRFFSELAKLGKQIDQGDVDMAAFKALNSTLGILLHYPAGQVNRTVEGVAAINDGRVEGLAILPALAFGPPRE